MYKVLVIGSINMDVVISVDRMPASGENVYTREVALICGGKGANQSGATAKLGLDTTFFGCVGDDANGAALRSTLKENGIHAEHVLVKGKQSGETYIIVEADGQNRILVAPAANELLTVEDIDRVAGPLMDHADMVLIQLEIPLACVERIIELGARKGVRVFVDAGPIRGCKASQLKNAWCISPNESELAALVDRNISTEEEMIAAAKELLNLGVTCVLIKLGGDGCFFISRSEQIRRKSYSVNVVDTTAAGDSFSAGFAAGILWGMSSEDAIIFASKCGAIAVTKKGASTSLPTRDAVDNFERDYLTV